MEGGGFGKFAQAVLMASFGQEETFYECLTWSDFKTLLEYGADYKNAGAPKKALHATTALQ